MSLAHRSLAPALDAADSELVAEIQSVMATIEEALDQLMPRRRDFVANALINLAVNRLRRQEGDQRAAAILGQLSQLVAGGARPLADSPITLAVQDA